LALGGSTNAIVHLIALARRVGVELSLDTFDALARARRRCSPTFAHPGSI
jgi:dihydroxyacid dehydratase/phosphogluconate dehydratase